MSAICQQKSAAYCGKWGFFGYDVMLMKGPGWNLISAPSTVPTPWLDLTRRPKASCSSQALRGLLFQLGDHRILVIDLTLRRSGFFVTAGVAGFPCLKIGQCRKIVLGAGPARAAACQKKSCPPSLDLAATVHDLHELADHAVVEAVITVLYE